MLRRSGSCGHHGPSQGSHNDVEAQQQCGPQHEPVYLVCSQREIGSSHFAGVAGTLKAGDILQQESERGAWW